MSDDALIAYTQRLLGHQWTHLHACVVARLLLDRAELRLLLAEQVGHAVEAERDALAKVRKYTSDDPSWELTMRLAAGWVGQP